MELVLPKQTNPFWEKVASSEKEIVIDHFQSSYEYFITSNSTTAIQSPETKFRLTIPKMFPLLYDLVKIECRIESTSEKKFDNSMGYPTIATVGVIPVTGKNRWI